MRYHERRACHRAVRRVPTAGRWVTRMALVTVAMLPAMPHEQWYLQRADRERRSQSRCLCYRFHKRPGTYLARL